VARGPFFVKPFKFVADVAGSPFTVEVMDPGTVIARGEGLVNGQVHHQAVFTVGTDIGADINVGECRITIYGTYVDVISPAAETFRRWCTAKSHFSD